MSEIVRYGKKLADYRPGLPLHEFMTVFVRPLPGKNDHPNADHVEQLQASQCFRAARERSAASPATIRTHFPIREPRWRTIGKSA